MMGMQARDRRALIVGAVSLLAMVVAFRVVRPALGDLRATSEAVTEQRALLARERALVAAAPGLPQARIKATRVLESSRARLFSGDSVAATAALTSYVSDVAAATGMQLRSIDGGTPATTGGITRLVAELRGEGAWRETMAFVRTLESSGRLVDVTSIRLERGPRGGPLGGDSVILSATVTGFALATQDGAP